MRQALKRCEADLDTAIKGEGTATAAVVAFDATIGNLHDPQRAHLVGQQNDASSSRHRAEVTAVLYGHLAKLDADGRETRLALWLAVAALLTSTVLGVIQLLGPPKPCHFI